MTRWTRGQRRALLVAHVASSVGWFGVSLAMLSLGLAGRLADTERAVGGAYWAAHLLVDVLVIPLSLVSLTTGVTLGLVTHWGLVRHRWVLTKLVLTVVTVTLGLFALRPGVMDAYRESGPGGDPDSLARAGDGLLYAGSVSSTTYLFVTVLSIMKPWGRTRWGASAR